MPTTLCFLPGLGADECLFAPLCSELTEFEILHPSLPPFRKRENLKDYARRVHSEIQEQVNSPKDAVLIGMSFGGQLALELAKNDAYQAVILLATHRYSHRITTAFKLQFRLGALLPDPLFSWALGFGAQVFSMRERLSGTHTRLLRDMAGKIDREQLLLGAQTAADWEHPDDSLLKTENIFQIHGKGDWVIPCILEDVDEILEDAKHLITYTHSAEIAKLIRRQVLETEGSQY